MLTKSAPILFPLLPCAFVARSQLLSAAGADMLRRRISFITLSLLIPGLTKVATERNRKGLDHLS